MRVLDREDRRLLVGRLRTRDRDRIELLDREPAVAAVERLDHQPRVRRGAAVLVDHDVREPVGDEDVARTRVELQGDLVRHRRRGKEERGLLAEELGGPFLQPRDRRVLAPLLVPHVGCRDRRAHAVRRPRRRVRAQVDHGGHPIPNGRVRPG